ncbi:MAG TPA: hypothetical protein VN419_10195 [Humidesulfovibrio sp.]|uniref:hypothetical protein n=1 Tax=Humidesulfovibrio sp. TaxID=2910988 RepID=UPI002CF8046E|nr:hypothetical protein [Humidesulfovibrio sp.]HWR04375.1 hypothetical protein [Humidesulfovibrio sp.]
MTISTQTSKAAFSGNGVSAVFPLPFPFQRTADIKALLRQDGFETPLVLGEHFELSGAGSAAGGSLTMLVPPATGQTLVVWRAPALVQEVDYVENSAFPAETHEAALDLLTMICQSLQEQIGRAVLYPVSTPAEDILDSSAFLAATQADKDAARASEQNAAASAAQAAASASLAAHSAAGIDDVAATLDGLVKVSAGDACGRSLSAKLLAGNGLSEGIENPGGDEGLRLSVALAADSGLEFAAGLVRVKAGTGLVRSGSGLAADVGTTAGKLLQLDEQGRMPTVDGRNLTNLPGGSASDLAAMNAFVAFMGAGRATGPLPKGGIWLCATDELSSSNALYAAADKTYSNKNVSLYAPTGAVFGSTWMSGGAGTRDGCFDGSTAKDHLGTAYETSGGWLGKAFASAQPIYAVKVYGSTDLGHVFNASFGSSTSQVTLKIYGKNSAPANATDGALLATDTFTNALSANPRTLMLSGTPYLYVWVVCTAASATYVCNAQIQYMAGVTTNMSLSSAAGVALGFVPTRATLYLLHKAVDGVTLNTDLVPKASRGSGWASASDLAEVCQFDGTYKMLKATMDLSALASGSTGLWGLDTHNLKAQQVRAALALFQ